MISEETSQVDISIFSNGGHCWRWICRTQILKESLKNHVINF